MNRSKSPAAYAQIITETFLFRGLGQERTQKILANAKGIFVEHKKRGEKIRSAEGAPSALCIIVEGSALVEKMNAGSAVRMSTLQKGDLFGAASMFCGEETYVAEITALTSVWSVVIPEEAFRSIIREEPCVMENYIRYLTGRIRFLSSRIDSLACGGIEERFLLALTSAAEDGRCTLSCSMESFANSLGVSRATLYRAQDSLIASGRLRKEGKTFYINPKEELKL